MVAGHLDDRATRGAGRNPEGVARTLHDQCRDRHLVELRQTARWRGPPGAARRLQGEREAKHADGAGRLRSAAGHPRAQGPTADEERQPAELARDQVADHYRPGSVELARRSGRASPGDAVRLLDERDGDSFRARGVRHRHQVSRGHPSNGSVTEDQRGHWLIGEMQVGVGSTMRGVHYEHRHTRHADTAAAGSGGEGAVLSVSKVAARA